MEKENELGDISLPESGNRQSKFVYFKIVLVPILVYIMCILCYFDIIKFKVGLDIVIIMGLMLVVALAFARHSAELGCCLFEQKKDIFKLYLQLVRRENQMVALMNLLLDTLKMCEMTTLQLWRLEFFLCLEFLGHL